MLEDAVRIVHTETFLFHPADGFLAHARSPVGEELFGNVGSFGPFPEKLFPAMCGAGLLESEPVTANAEVLGVEIAATQSGDVGTEFAEAKPFCLWIGFR